MVPEATKKITKRVVKIVAGKKKTVHQSKQAKNRPEAKVTLNIRKFKFKNKGITMLSSIRLSLSPLRGVEKTIEI